MARKAEEYIVGILFAYEDRTEIKYVTEIDMQTKFAKWEDGKEAMTFSNGMPHSRATVSRVCVQQAVPKSASAKDIRRIGAASPLCSARALISRGS